MSDVTDFAELFQRLIQSYTLSPQASARLTQRIFAQERHDPPPLPREEHTRSRVFPR